MFAVVEGLDRINCSQYKLLAIKPPFLHLNNYLMFNLWRDIFLLFQVSDKKLLREKFCIFLQVSIPKAFSTTIM